MQKEKKSFTSKVSGMFAQKPYKSELIKQENLNLFLFKFIFLF